MSAASRKKIIFFELNEVPFRVLDEYCRRHPRSVLAQKLSSCRQFETRSDDADLSPWITWPTVHRGVVDTKHTIHYFGQHVDRVDAQYPPLWKILASHGVRTGVFASLHTYPPPKDADRYAFFLPDTFAPGSESFPDKLTIFQDFNLTMSRRSPRNISTGIPLKAGLKLLASAPSLGLKAGTLLSTFGQVLAERRDPWRRVRRRTYQVVLGFDIFMKQLRATRPDFATFYTNHVASAMHRYWAATFPQDYDTFDYDAEWVSRFANEIDFAMDWFNTFFERMTRFVDAHPEYALWVITSMGQAATKAVRMETQLYLTDIERFMRTLGMEGLWKRMPAMEPQVSLQVADGAVDRFRTLVQGIRIDGKPIEVDEREKGFFCISLGHPNLQGKVESAIVENREISFSELGMEHVPIEDLTNGSAQHVPGGLLLIYEKDAGTIPAGRPVISTLEIAPAILRNFGVTVPDYMAAGRLAAADSSLPAARSAVPAELRDAS